MSGRTFDISKRSIEIVEMRYVNPRTLETKGAPVFAILARSRYGSTTVKVDGTLEDLGEQLGCELTDQRSLWEYVELRDPSIGTWDGDLLDPSDYAHGIPAPADRHSLIPPGLES